MILVLLGVIAVLIFAALRPAPFLEALKITSTLIVILVLIFLVITIYAQLNVNKEKKMKTWEQECTEKGGVPLRGINQVFCADRNSLKEIKP